MIKERQRRLGPTWAEVVFSFLCSMLTATDVMYGRSSNLPQSAESYYFAFPEVAKFHSADVVVNSLFVILTLAWIVLPASAKLVRPALLVVALVGFGLCWAEILWAARVDSGSWFNLTNLPFRPVGNSGLLGAEVYGAYTLLKLPSGKLNEWQSSLLKVGLAACLWVLQLLVWDGYRRLVGLGS